MYYIDNLNITFTFIGFSENWASESNQDLLEIPGYSQEQCIRSNKKKREEQIYVDKIIVNTNIIIGEIYNPPSSNVSILILKKF